MQEKTDCRYVQRMYINLINIPLNLIIFVLFYLHFYKFAFVLISFRHYGNIVVQKWWFTTVCYFSICKYQTITIWPKFSLQSSYPNLCFVTLNTIQIIPLQRTMIHDDCEKYGLHKMHVGIHTPTETRKSFGAPRAIVCNRRTLLSASAANDVRRSPRTVIKNRFYISTVPIPWILSAISQRTTVGPSARSED